MAELNYRQGVNPATGTDFIIRRNDGIELEIDISTATTVGDVLDLINNHPDNLDPTTAVLARLQAFGNGIELLDDNPASGESLTVSRVSGSNTAWELGLVTWGRIVHKPLVRPQRRPLRSWHSRPKRSEYRLPCSGGTVRHPVERC